MHVEVGKAHPCHLVRSQLSLSDLSYKLEGNLGFASQWLIMRGQFWLQKRSSSMNAIQEMVGYLIVSSIIMILICLLGSACDCCVDKGWYLKVACSEPTHERKGFDNERSKAKGWRVSRSDVKQAEDRNWKPVEWLQASSKGLFVNDQWVMDWSCIILILTWRYYQCRYESRGCRLWFTAKMHNRCSWYGGAAKASNFNPASQHCSKHWVCSSQVRDWHWNITVCWHVPIGQSTEKICGKKWIWQGRYGRGHNMLDAI